MILRDARVYVGPYDLSGDHNQIGIEIAHAELDDTRFGHTAESVAAGLEQITVTGSGFARLGPTGTRVIRESLGLANVPMTIMSGDPANEPAAVEMFKGMALSYKVGAQAGQLLAFSWTAKGQGSPAHAGDVLVSRGALITVDGESVPQNLGALDDGARLFVALHVLAVSGAGASLALNVESDNAADFLPSGGAPTVRAAFTGLTAPTSAQATITGPIADTWWRATWTVAGTDPSFDCVLIIGREQ